MDDLDRIAESQEALNEFAINKIRSKAGRTLLFIKHCYYCDENLKSLIFSAMHVAEMIGNVNKGC